MKTAFLHRLGTYLNEVGVAFLGRVQGVLSPAGACTVQNLFMQLTLSPSRFGYDEARGFYFAREDNVVRYFKEMSRGFSLYARGIKARGEDLYQSYCLDKVDFSKGDVVVDCGANYADLFLELAGQIHEKDYITFEPGPEYASIVLNVPKARNEQLGLSDHNGEMTFYLCSVSGDSSLVEPKSYTHTTKVQVTTLDSYAAKHKLKACKLLKLEAEGFEPEILAGAGKFLQLCDYVAVDGGPERGKTGDQTFTDVANVLYAAGFTLVDVRFGAYRALFKRTAKT